MFEAIMSWDTLWWFLMIMYVPACLGLILIVLLQKGKGTGFAGAFGAGAGPGSEAVFGPRANQSLPVRLTYVAATLFMVIAVAMSMVSNKVGRGIAPELETVEAAPTVTDDLLPGIGSAGGGVSDAVEERPAAEAGGTPAPSDEESEESDGSS